MTFHLHESRTLDMAFDKLHCHNFTLKLNALYLTSIFYLIRGRWNLT